MPAPLRPVLIAPLVFALVACMPTREDDDSGGFDVARSDKPHDQNPQVDADEADQLTVGNHLLALDLYHQLSDGQAADQSFSLSPYSLQSAFGMLYAGTVNPAKEELRIYLHFTLDVERQHVGNNWLDAQLAARNLPALTNDPQYGDQDPVIVETANGVWIPEDLEPEISPSYLDILSVDYDAGVYLAQFRSQPEIEREGINAWVSKRTHDLIPELLPKGVISTDTVMVLVNAMYLKAPWADPFQVEQTALAPFTRLDGSSVDVNMMHSAELEAGYAEGDGWQALAVPMRGGDLELVVILPDSFKPYEELFTPAILAEVFDALTTTIVDTKLPRFEIDAQFELTNELRALGINSPFDDPRSFDAIVPDLGVITAVVHQTVIEVDEKGTEAAAATGIVIDDTALPEPGATIEVDRPFILAIRDRPTNAVLFLGRVLEP